MRRTRVVTLVIVVALVVAIVGIASAPRFRNGGTIAAATQPGDIEPANPTDPTSPKPDPTGKDVFVPFEYIHFYTYDKKDAEFYFGPNAWVQANAAVAAGDVKEHIEYITNADGTGDFWYRMQFDPALTAAVALQLDLTGASGECPILKEELDLDVKERADHATLRFMSDREAWKWAYSRIKSILLGEGATWWIADLNEYTSAMYMVKDGLGVGIPSVVVKKTDNKSGHAIVFKVQTEKDGPFVEVWFRLECGYQPIDPPGWEPPPDEPTPTPTVTPPPSGTPTPTPTSTPTPTPKPKNVGNDPQNKVDPTEPGADDFKSPNPSNQNPDKTVTEEPTSPASYATPTPPPPVTATPTPKPTAAPTATPTPKPTAAPTPVTGNSQSGNWKNLDDVANNTPAKPVTNEPVSGDVPPPE